MLVRGTYPYLEGMSTFGYADEFCKMEIFDQSPNRLRKMIENGQKNARKKFERFDLDGNIEERKK